MSKHEYLQKNVQLVVCALIRLISVPVLKIVQNPVESKQEKRDVKKVKSQTVSILTFQYTLWACVITAITDLVEVGPQQAAHMQDNDLSMPKVSAKTVT